ncbi:InlB B-repeat-containing protein [Saccharicrinis aurantiacus]|uniref:InlB B-repeat-containing protein n=1 Tax=Saccharicrinis aurantiacus TaxID=1849719 RepID=UPI00248F4730|nr:T9SS type A sorting domain-containing protein [Saccharicrinis aurantiacus]
MNKFIIKSLLLLVVLFPKNELLAQEYPFDLPVGFKAKMSINTNNKEEYNNLQLGTNIHGFTSSEERAYFLQANPITVRFPHGLYSNWYDWEQDKARVFGTETFAYDHASGPRTKTIDHLSTIQLMDNSNIIVGIEGLNTLNNARIDLEGEGYDMIWTFNMSADGTDMNNGSPVSVARYKDLIERGFQVKVVEMGNENFYPGQRSSIIPNTQDYISRAKSMSAALKAEDPNIKVSIPLLRRENSANPLWNQDLTQDISYFDAITIHTYVGSNPDDETTSDEAYSTALTAREVLRKTIDDYPMQVAPNKPIWLSEWGVKSGGPNAVSALGMADCYIFMSENSDVYERANWFSDNGKLNSFVVWHDVDVNGTLRPRIKYPLERTAFGSTYQVIRSVFQNSTLLQSTMDAPQLIDNVDAISARAVEKDGVITLFVLNLTDKEVPFDFDIDGIKNNKSFTHKAVSYSTMDEEVSIPIDTEILSLIKKGEGDITLPKFSINTIVLDGDLSPLRFKNLQNNQEILRGSDLQVEAIAEDDYTEVSLFVNNTDLGKLNEAPFVWNSHDILGSIMEDSYTLQLVAMNTDGEEFSEEIIIYTSAQWPYSNDNKPHSLTEKVEFEHYDYGGQGVAYFDRTELNTSSYRSDEFVDLSSDGTVIRDIKANEWLEFTVDVEQAGYYDVKVNHQTRRFPEFEQITLTLPKTGLTLLENIILTNTGSGTFLNENIGKVQLGNGIHLLRFHLLNYGFDLDYFEFNLSSISHTITFNDGTNFVNVLTNEDGNFTLPNNPVNATKEFVEWQTADGQVFDASTIVTDDIEVFAQWKIKTFALSIISDNGAVTISPEQDEYEINTEVILTAFSAEGYEFESWTGGYVGSENPLSITISSDAQITANYNTATAIKVHISSILSIGPNPTSGSFTIQLIQPEEAQYKIYTASGQLIEAGHFINKTTVDINSNTKGILLLEIITSRGKEVQKILLTN